MNKTLMWNVTFLNSEIRVIRERKSLQKLVKMAFGKCSE